MVKEIITYLRSVFYRIKLIIKNPTDVIYLKFDKRVLETKQGIILITHESNKLGASLLVQHIAEEIVKNGRNVYIITRQFGVLNKEYKAIAPLQIIFTKAGYRRALRKLSKLGYCDIIANTVLNGDLTEISLEEGHKIINLIHEMPQMIKILSAEKKMKEIIEKSSLVVYPTTLMKDKIESELSLSSSSYKIMPQGIYMKFLSEEEICFEKQQLLERVQLEGKKVVIGVGNTTKIKGFDLFFRMAKSAQENYIFLWAGKKEAFFDEVIAENKEGAEKFVYLGEMSSKQLAALYSTADALALTSRIDSFPSVMLEAMAYGVPVFGFSFSGGVSELVVKGFNGDLVDSAEPELLLEKIVYYCNGENREFRTNATETARKYRFDNYVKEILGYFE